VTGRDITEGRGDSLGYGRSIAVDLGIVSSTSIWQNTTESFDVAVGGLPFFYAISDARPYVRQTAPFRKDQSDIGAEPGEQSLTGWWLRSQSSFHHGAGIKFYDPSAGETVLNRFNDSQNVDVWTKGQVTLLKETSNMTGYTTGIYKTIAAKSGSTDVVIAWIPGSTTFKSLNAAGTTITTYAPTGLGNIIDVTTDGTYLYAADADHIYYGAITNSGAGWSEYYNTGSSSVHLGWVKQRLVAGIGPSIYELTNARGSSHTLPTPIYTHPNPSWVWNSISEGENAIYASGYAGLHSTIFEFTLPVTTGAMPVLTQAVTAAALPFGEIVNSIYGYLGFMVIGTNKGVRIGSLDTSGHITYGPLSIEASNTGYDFAVRDTFVYATGSIGGFAGCYRINLAEEITTTANSYYLSTRRYPYATDTFLSTATGYATSICFVGDTDQLVFTTSGSNGIAIQSLTTLATTGYVTTGKIRFNTLEPKNFKRLLGRGTFTAGNFTLASVATSAAGVETIYDHITYNSGVPAVEVTTSIPAVAQEYLAYKFTLDRDSTTTSTGPTFRGYQAKATIATPRQRVIKFPVWCYDTETDRFNVVTGYEGRAYARIQLLEDIERGGDILTFQDLTTGETLQVYIEETTFTRMTPPDRRFDGFGGIIEITVRTV
jgi:hypothetical protein